MEDKREETRRIWEQMTQNFPEVVKDKAWQKAYKVAHDNALKEYKELKKKYPNYTDKELKKIGQKDKQRNLAIYKKFYLTGIYKTEAECICAMQEIGEMNNLEIMKYLGQWRQEKRTQLKNQRTKRKRK